jgi:hypothetical protein
MTQMQIPVTCPHCGAINAPGAPSCHACAKAFPPAIPPAHQLAGAPGVTASPASAELQVADLDRKAQTSVKTLLLIGILAVVFAAFTYQKLNDPQYDHDAVLVLLGLHAFTSVVFLGLWFWARRSPFLPALIGLILYVSLQVGLFVVNPPQGRMSIPWLPILFALSLLHATWISWKSQQVRRQFELR